MTILQLQARLHESGRIRIGQQVPTGSGRKRPAKLDAFRFTSQDKRALEKVADLYGGQIRRWEEAPVGEQYEVFTNTAEIRVAVPPERMGLTQSLELWSGGGIVRRCDGQRQQTDEPCLCAALADDDPQPRCARHTRLSLMLADLATSGLWRLDSQGYYASEELAGAFELAQLLQQATGRAILPGWLRLEQREIRRPGEPKRQFAVPVLDLEMDAAALFGRPQPADGAGLLEATAVDDSEMAPPDRARSAYHNPPPPPAGLTPVPPEAPPSLAAELAEQNQPKAKAPPRKNSQAPIPSTGRKPRTAAQRAAAPVGQPPPRATSEQLSKLHLLFRTRGYESHDDRLDWANSHLDRVVMASAELYVAEAGALIDLLEAEPAVSAVQDAVEQPPSPPEQPEGSVSSGGSTAPAGAAQAPEEEINPDQMGFDTLPPGQAPSENAAPPEKPGDAAPSENGPPPADPAPSKDLVGPDGLSHIDFLRNDAGVSDAWMRKKLAEIGIEDIPSRGRIGNETLKKLTRQEAKRLRRDLVAEGDRQGAWE
jgi:hypothetical protein